MDKLLLYLLQSQLSLVLLFSIYMLVLRKQTNFRFNRIFLILSIIFSALIPLIDFGISPSSALYYVQLPEIEIGAIQNTASEQIRISSANVFSIIYLFVSFSIFMKLIFNLLSIIKLRYRSEKFVVQGQNIGFLINTSQNFSFFSWIFIKEEDQNKQSIIEHEKAHSRLLHSLDIIIIKLFQSVFWINPLGFFIERELRLQHEYEVDQWVLSKYSSLIDYQQLLLNQVFQTEFNLITNNFNQSFLKNRFTMMTKTENKNRKVLFVMLIMSIIIIPFIFSCSMESKDEVEIQQPEEEPAQPTKPAVPNIEKITLPVIDTLTSQDSTFTLVDKMPSFVGGQKGLYKYIGDNITYPEAAKKEGIEGRCFVSFIIEKDGSVSNVEILRGVTYGYKKPEHISAAKLCDQEALNIIKNMPNWEPGEHEGKKVRVVYRMPIKFTLQ